MSETELTPEQVEGIANDAGVGLADHNRRSRCLCLRCQSGRALLLTRRQLEQERERRKAAEHECMTIRTYSPGGL